MLRRLKTIVRDLVREELERARPQQIAEATNAAQCVFERNLDESGILDGIRRASALEAELLETGLLDRLRAMSERPGVSLEAMERRSKLATQQAVARAFQQFDTVKNSTDRLIQHVPGFVNAMASVPALANLIRQQRMEIDGLKAAGEARASDQAGQAAAEIDRLRSSLERNVQEAHDELLAAIEARAAEKDELLQAKIDANRSALEQELVEQGHIWEAIARANVETGNLWKSAELTTREIGNLWQRAEFIRSEILYEMKYSLERGNAATGPAVPPAEESAVVEPRIRNPKLIDEAPPEGFKINIGCGQIARTGYVNVDARQLPGVDVIADLGKLPFEEKTVGEIYSAHVLEHFPQEHLKRLLPYWRSLMKPGGRFRAIVPDGEASLAGIADGSYSFADFREVLFGGQEYEGDFHFNLFTPKSLTELLRAAKFKNIEIVEKARKNGNCFEFEIGAEA